MSNLPPPPMPRTPRARTIGMFMIVLAGMEIIFGAGTLIDLRRFPSGWYVGDQYQIRDAYYRDFQTMQADLVIGLFSIVAVALSIIGGVMSLRRKEFGLVMTVASFDLAATTVSAIISVIYLPPISIAFLLPWVLLSVILCVATAVSKWEFSQMQLP